MKLADRLTKPELEALTRTLVDMERDENVQEIAEVLSTERRTLRLCLGHQGWRNAAGEELHEDEVEFIERFVPGFRSTLTEF